jgi:tetratricopeptide (TPR) repeat protein
MTRARLFSIAAFALAGVSGRAALAGPEEALAAFKARRYLEAASEMQAVVDRSQGYAYGHFLLGHCMLKMGRIGEANREFRYAIGLDGRRPEFYQGWALSLQASGNWPLTARAATQGLQYADEPQERFALLALRGYAWGALRRWDEAVADLESALRIKTETWVLIYLGKARFAAGDYAIAVGPLRQALGTSPDNPAILRLLAEDLLRLAAEERDTSRKHSVYAEALGYAQRLVSIVPEDIDAVHLVGRAALGAGKLDQAEHVFRHVIFADPRQCYALADLGRTYMAASRWGEAEAYLRKAAACAPRMAPVYESLGELYLQIGKPQEAAAAFRRHDEIEPTGASASLPGTVPVFAPR